MNIIVCMKQVPDTNEVRINQETGTLIRDGVPSIMNPDDKNAIEGALALKDLHGGHVTILCMGPPQARDALNEALAMGADEAILLSDRAFAGSDTWATSTILAAAIEAIGNYDIVFCGRQAIDGDTAQVGPETAEFLNIPQVTYVKDIKLEGDKVQVTRYTEYGDYVMEVKTPLMLTAIKELNEPRLPSVRGIFKAYSEDNVKVWTMDNLKIDPTQIGLKGSPTNVFRSFVPVKEKNSHIIEGLNGKEKAAALIGKLSDLKLI
ncbi:electron transfer flavoprotein subunit beta/FixA family protein [Sinanaerobacter chloroacetimidivorans]|uniref:Electron transfer flavoprotein small subunit n=1 Tax=Sinanaerobacter chloroacetimidivorans TaxID=2818044 RepID=A0A8J7W2S9_9FIRM|nr:electron transfer flavoprotein subunit beta/FixA family protein [Sinanaerobacter chloroacetimidivorans]MBR0599834.1 electron transfer flavoprotein subunit beta/FixA family protein [Sinanaerobacter chloroacetimidivorans]